MYMDRNYCFGTGFERRPQEGFQLDKTTPQMREKDIFFNFLVTRDMTRSDCYHSPRVVHVMETLRKCTCCEEKHSLFCICVNK